MTSSKKKISYFYDPEVGNFYYGQVKSTYDSRNELISHFSISIFLHICFFRLLINYWLLFSKKTGTPNEAAPNAHDPQFTVALRAI